MWSLTIEGGGSSAKTTPLIVKYIYIGNMHYLEEKQQFKNCNKETTLKHRGGGQQGVVKDHTFTFFGPFPKSVY